MKNKIVLLGMFAALFALSLPLYADPGGTAVVSVSTANLSIDAVAQPAAVLERVVTVAILGTVALVPVLFLFSRRVRAFAIPWRSSVANSLKRTSDNVRRNFAKLTKSPVLKHQFAA